jgi:uncharacterized radical SAM superfamily Fe-S cluster-containing enzyme
MTRKNRPYLFYDTTSSVCSTCLRVVEAKIVVKDSNVFMDKWCPAHGTQRVLVSDDAEYYRLCREVYIKPPEMPERFKHEDGIRLSVRLRVVPGSHAALLPDAGRDHRQLQLRCPVCFAGSGPERQTHKAPRNRARHARRRWSPMRARRMWCRSPVVNRRCIPISSRFSTRRVRGRFAISW